MSNLTQKISSSAMSGNYPHHPSTNQQPFPHQSQQQQQQQPYGGNSNNNMSTNQVPVMQQFRPNPNLNLGNNNNPTSIQQQQQQQPHQQQYTSGPLPPPSSLSSTGHANPAYRQTQSANPGGATYPPASVPLPPISRPGGGVTGAPSTQAQYSSNPNAPANMAVPVIQRPAGGPQQSSGFQQQQPSAQQTAEYEVQRETEPLPKLTHDLRNQVCTVHSYTTYKTISYITPIYLIHIYCINAHIHYSIIYLS